MKKTVGIACLTLGIMLSFYALTMEVAVEYNVGNTMIELYSHNPNLNPNKIANNDLLNRRICYFILASTMCIVGTILMAVPEPAKTENEQSQLLLSQLNMLSSIAGRLNVPLNEINEVMEPYGVKFEV